MPKMATNVNNSAHSDNDRIYVIDDDTTSASTLNVQSFPMVNKNANKERRPNIRRYASFSNRIMKRGGRSNVIPDKIRNKDVRYMKDMGNTLVNAQWRWILISLCVANGIAYVIFAGIWMAMATLNGDYDVDLAKERPCIVGANSFTGYFMFSMETLSTLGYGRIYPTECQPTWIIITLQALTGVTIQGALVTAVFVKMSRPYNKDPVTSFSKKAVICMRDGILCLIFRVRDIYGKHWAKTTIKAILIKRRKSPEGEVFPYYFEPIKLDKEGLLFWPQEIIHRITTDSPLWSMSSHDLYKARFEIMVILEGDSIVTGEPSQSQTSYTNKEIKWGYRFVPCVEYDKEQHKYVIQHEKFNDIVKCDTPLCSALELGGLHKEALKPADMWDSDIMFALFRTPASSSSVSSPTTVFKFPSYRVKKNDIDAGVPRESRKFSEIPMETIKPAENLAASNIRIDEDKEEEKKLMSTNF